LSDMNRLYLLIAGEGSNLAHCRELAERLRLERVIFHSPWLVEETSSLLSAAHLLLLSTRGNQSLVSTPSKLLHYMLAGRPVLASASPESDLADIVRQAGCGWTVSPDDPDELAKAICRIMLVDSAELVRMGHAGREFFLAHYAADVCLPKVIHILEQASLSNA